jgi:hypothetical protein
MNIIANNATITFSARFLSQDPMLRVLLGFTGSIGAVDSAEAHSHRQPVAGQPLRTMAGDAGHSTG